MDLMKEIFGLKKDFKPGILDRGMFVTFSKMLFLDNTFDNKKSIINQNSENWDYACVLVLSEVLEAFKIHRPEGGYSWQNVADCIRTESKLAAACAANFENDNFDFIMLIEEEFNLEDISNRILDCIRNLNKSLNY